jgi:Cu-processing system permease protein
MIQRKFTIWGALAYATLLESARRKDLYVALILSVLMIAAAAVLARFGASGLELFIKDVAMTVINVLSVILTVIFSARQIPEELARRTVYPLLARPITRFDLLFGKFLGAFAMSIIALLLFAAVSMGGLAALGLKVGFIFGQFLLLRIFALGLLSAMTITFSLFMTPAATVTISLLCAIGASTFTQAILLVDGDSSGLGQQFLRFSYFVFPHLDLFDLSKKVSHGWNPIAAMTVVALGAYATIHASLLFFAGFLRFRKQAL